MTIVQVSRITPQDIVGVRVSMGDGGQVAGQIAALQAAILPHGYKVESLTDLSFYGGWRLRIMHGEDPDQFAYPDDWIVVTDATYDPTAGWTVSESTQVWVYGTSTGLLGTALDFVKLFHCSGCPIIWSATSAAPAATPSPSLGATLVFQQPASANGPWTYAVTQTDTTDNTSGAATLTGSPSIDASGNVTLTVADNSLVSGKKYTFVVTVTTFDGQTAESLPSTEITAA